MLEITPRENATQPRRGNNTKEDAPFEACQIDFTNLPKTTGNCKYLLVIVDTFSGWVEAYLTRTEKVTEVVKTQGINEFPDSNSLTVFSTGHHLSLKSPRK